MSLPPLQLPVMQHWSCHNCGGCCRQHAIEVTAEEKDRIESQGWPKEPGFEGVPLFTANGGLPWSRRYRLNHRDDGSCVFLDDRGLCRIHAKFGEPAKPLACRVYPYAFHPAGGKIAVSLRFSCPSVVANRGRSLSENRAELQELERLVVPASGETIPPPKVNQTQSLEWRDLLLMVRALDESLAEADLPITQRLCRTLLWVRLVEQSRFEKLQGSRLGEYLDLVQQAAAAELPELLGNMPDPPAIARVQFRQLVAQYARKDTEVELRQGWRARWKLLRAAIRFSRGTGMTPVLQAGFRAVPFAEIERTGWLVPAEAEELLTRYLRVKIQGLHFCGRPYYDVPFTEGFEALSLIIPSLLWIARWWALSHGRDQLTQADVQQGMAVADHHHGYSAIFGTSNFRRRIRMLAETNAHLQLIQRYGQFSADAPSS